MARLHFLNVKEGDCSVLQHPSGRVSVIDVCNATPVGTTTIEDQLREVLAKADKGISGNFQQKKYPINPIAYMKDHGISSVWRYIQTHPDMDHMDGIEAFFGSFSPTVLWDTDNNKEMASPWNSAQYQEEDWKCYKAMRDGKAGPQRLTNLSGDIGKYWNQDDAGGLGDNLYILAPTQALVDEANAHEDYHRASYVLLWQSGTSRIVVGGDSHDASWDHILENHEADVTNVDLLIAPHHGRKSGRSYRFLDTLNPTLTFFGNAPHEHLAYSAWSNRGLQKITNNQANCMVVDTSQTPMVLYVTHGNFARRVNPDTFYIDTVGAWYVGPITDDLLGA